ncbi:MAG: DUF1553 domain-containing protein, partial [Bacteroidota bacterium]
LWAEVTGGGGGSTANYVQDKGENNYRRSLYTFWKRTVPPPNMLLFDTPTRDFCMVQRENTSTPLQALVLMNDPQFLEASKALAIRAYNDKAGKKEEVIQLMFALATSRYPEENELQSLIELYNREEAVFIDDQQKAKAYLSYGDKSPIIEQNISEIAAYCLIANTIFNLDETIRKS